MYSQSNSNPISVSNRVSIIASKFVSSYYVCLASEPGELYTYYDDDSIVRIEESESNTSTEVYEGQLVSILLILYKFTAIPIPIPIVLM